MTAWRMNPDEYWCLFAAKQKSNERIDIANNGGKHSGTKAWLDKAKKALKDAKDNADNR